MSTQNPIGTGALLTALAHGNSSGRVALGTSLYSTGYAPNDVPAAGHHNALWYDQAAATNYSLLRGIPEWVSNKNYPAAAAVTSLGNIWLSTVANNLNSPPSLTNSNWAKISLGSEAITEAITGFKVTHSGGNTVSISGGSCCDETGRVVIRSLAGMSKNMGSAWGAGSGNGGRIDTTALAGDQTLHIYVIFNPTTGAVDFCARVHTGVANVAETGASHPVVAARPSGFVYHRRIASLLVRGGNIVPFKQRGSIFRLNTPRLSLQNIAPTATPNTPYALDAPLGTYCFPSMVLTINDPGGMPDQDQSVRVYELGESAATSFPVSLTNAFAHNFYRERGGSWKSDQSNIINQIAVNELSQIGISRHTSGSGANVNVAVEGWMDPRLIY